MNKIKQFLFRVMENNLNLITKIGISKNIPGVMPIYNFLFKSSWPYGDIIEIQGSKMFVGIKDASPSLRKTFEAYALNKIHEEITTELFKNVLKEGDVFIDLGANIGYFSLLASRLVGKKGKVFSFEPEPTNFSCLKKNLEINNYRQARSFLKAVSDKNGKIKLFVCDYDTGHHTINQYEGIKSYSRGRSTVEKEIEIDAVTLDSFLGDKTDRVDVIKMDVEGAEMLALIGMDKVLRDNMDIKMFIEFFPLLIKEMGSSPEEFIRRLLEDYKFSVFIIPNDYNASAGEMVKINSVSDVMSLIKAEDDHINMFLKRG